MYQERVLSRRLIAFSGSGFFLYCHTKGPRAPIGDHFLGVSATEKTIMDLELWKMQQTGKPFSSNYMHWPTIVSEYSGLGLSKLAQDRLVALAGIASEVGRSIEAERTRNRLCDEETSSEHTLRYACGLWLVEPRIDLYWEQATTGLRRRVPGLPTWSWASMADRIKRTDNGQEILAGGMGVRWPMTWLGNPESVSKIRNTTVIATEDNQSWLPQFNQPLRSIPEYQYGNATRFVILTLEGRLLPVHIGSQFTDMEAELAADLTNIEISDPDSINSALEPLNEKRPWGAELWRGVCLPSKPNTILGWASLEHPEMQSDSTVTSSGQIFAFFLGRNEEKGGWLRLGPWLVDRIFYNVLLLRRATTSTPGFDNCFERVGIGGLWGLEVDKQYQSAPETTLSLI